MKKIAFALALALPGAASFAQSNVTLFGIVDTAVTHVSFGGSGHITGMTTGQNATSRIGFRGTEDLGGGLAANFWLEGELFTDAGNPSGLNFLRRSTLSLSGNNWGEIRLGRDTVPTYSNNSQFDPQANRGIGGAVSYSNFVTTVRQDNMVAYFTPSTLGGFFGSAAYGFGEAQSNLANDKKGSYYGARVGYANGPLSAGIATGEHKQAIGGSNTAPISIGNDLRVTNMAVSYDFGFIKPVLFYGEEAIKGGPRGASQINSTLIGFNAPLGSGELRATYGHYDMKDSPNDFNKIAFSYSYFLSKRTSLYGTAALLHNKGASARGLTTNDMATTLPKAGRNASGYEVGIRHNF